MKQPLILGIARQPVEDIRLSVGVPADTGRGGGFSAGEPTWPIVAGATLCVLGAVLVYVGVMLGRRFQAAVSDQRLFELVADAMGTPTRRRRYLRELARATGVEAPTGLLLSDEAVARLEAEREAAGSIAGRG